MEKTQFNSIESIPSKESFPAILDVVEYAHVNEAGFVAEFRQIMHIHPYL